jgi:UDP-N-acetylmuramoyl-L-alanyl-D-glutamate--2,6-diaminopimelate ligase
VITKRHIIVAIEAVSGSKEVAVHKIEFDSRKIEVNDVLSLFVVLRRHDYIQKAIELEQ